MPFARKDQRRKPPQDLVATEDASRLAGEAPTAVDQALDGEWYERHGGKADRAAFTLCRLRRARAGAAGGPLHGDEAVRDALSQASPEAVIWIASRAISFMDENGFPEAVAPWFDEDDSDGGR